MGLGSKGEVFWSVSGLGESGETNPGTELGPNRGPKERLGEARRVQEDQEQRARATGSPNPDTHSGG